jgi:hypothetical protein
MSPSGKLLAVAGSTGLQIFHFNGASPVTPYKTLLTSGYFDGVYWDNSNHLYAIEWNSYGKGKLYAYTITPTSVTEAPGSPYAIPNPEYLIVQPK